jgi:hypothetical protein
MPIYAPRDPHYRSRAIMQGLEEGRLAAESRSNRILIEAQARKAELDAQKLEQELDRQAALTESLKAFMQTEQGGAAAPTAGIPATVVPASVRATDLMSAAVETMPVAAPLAAEAADAAPRAALPVAPAAPAAEATPPAAAPAAPAAPAATAIPTTTKPEPDPRTAVIAGTFPEVNYHNTVDRAYTLANQYAVAGRIDEFKANIMPFVTRQYIAARNAGEYARRALEANLDSDEAADALASWLRDATAGGVGRYIMVRDQNGKIAGAMPVREGPGGRVEFGAQPIPISREFMDFVLNSSKIGQFMSAYGSDVVEGMAKTERGLSETRTTVETEETGVAKTKAEARKAEADAKVAEKTAGSRIAAAGSEAARAATEALKSSLEASRATATQKALTDKEHDLAEKAKQDTRAAAEAFKEGKKTKAAALLNGVIGSSAALIKKDIEILQRARAAELAEDSTADVSAIDAHIKKLREDYAAESTRVGKMQIVLADTVDRLPEDGDVLSEVVSISELGAEELERAYRAVMGGE